MPGGLKSGDPDQGGALPWESWETQLEPLEAAFGTQLVKSGVASKIAPEMP